MSSIVVRAQTPQEEYSYVLFLLKDTELLNDKNYTVLLPEHAEFRKYIKNPQLIYSADLPKLGKVFLNEIYDLTQYTKGVRVIESDISTIKQCLKLLNPFHENWNFSVYQKYEIRLTLYGPGGGYWAQDPSDTAYVTLLTTPEGQFRSRPIQVIMHEIVHLGIEDVIVQRFHLNAKEKETVVELFCTIVFGHILKNFHIQQFGQDQLTHFVNTETVSNLPQAMQLYMKDYPRTIHR